MSKIIGRFLLVLFALAIVVVIIAFPVMLLWNWLMPLIFGLKVITFWQAFGLALLSSLLFKSSNYNYKK